MISSILANMPDHRAEFMIRRFRIYKNVDSVDDLTVEDLRCLESDLRDMCVCTLDLMEKKGVGKVRDLDSDELWKAMDEEILKIIDVRRKNSVIVRAMAEAVVAGYTYCVTHGQFTEELKKDSAVFQGKCLENLGIAQYCNFDHYFDVYPTKGAFEESVGETYEKAESDELATTVDNLYVFFNREEFNKNRSELERSACYVA